MDGDPYELLEVEAGASEPEIRAAYRRLLQLYHPDRYTSESAEVRAFAEQRMANLNAAFRILTDPMERAQHERVQRARRAARSREGMTAAPRREPPAAARDRSGFGSSPGDRRAAGSGGPTDPHEQQPPPEPDPDFDYRRAAAAEFSVATPRPARTEFTAHRTSGAQNRRRRWLRRG